MSAGPWPRPPSRPTTAGCWSGSSGTGTRPRSPSWSPGTGRRIEYAYDGQQNLYLITSYDAASGGSVVNQVQRAFNGLGQLVQEWQATSGAVNTSTTPSVQYAYSFAPSGSTIVPLPKMLAV